MKIRTTISQIFHKTLMFRLSFAQYHTHIEASGTPIPTHEIDNTVQDAHSNRFFSFTSPLFRKAHRLVSFFCIAVVFLIVFVMPAGFAVYSFLSVLNLFQHRHIIRIWRSLLLFFHSLQPGDYKFFFFGFHLHSLTVCLASSGPASFPSL